MLQRKTWTEFREAKMLWWINRMLHLFGWAIVLEQGDDGLIVEAYPARVKYRGFTEQVEAEGFAGLTEHLRANVGQLTHDIKSPLAGAETSETENRDEEDQ